MRVKLGRRKGSYSPEKTKKKECRWEAPMTWRKTYWISKYLYTHKIHAFSSLSLSLLILSQRKTKRQKQKQNALQKHTKQKQSQETKTPKAISSSPPSFPSFFLEFEGIGIGIDIQIQEHAWSSSWNGCRSGLVGPCYSGRNCDGFSGVGWGGVCFASEGSTEAPEEARGEQESVHCWGNRSQASGRRSSETGRQFFFDRVLGFWENWGNG